MPNNKNGNYNHTELIWDGKFEESIKLPQKRAVEKIVLPFQTIEVINEPREGTGSNQLFSGRSKAGWRNKLAWGDNKLVMSSFLKEYAGKINLIYIDPPFDVGADFSINVKVGDEEITKEPSILEQKAYNDTWGRGTNSYLQMMYERLPFMRSLLAEDGSIYVHCDWRVNSYLKLMMDEVFSGWQYSEIIWVCGLMGSGSVYPKSHETILFYRRPESVFNMPSRPGLSQRITGALQRDEKGWYYTRGQESSGGKDYLKSYVSDNPNLTKEEAIVVANQNRPQPVWDVWMGKEDLAKAFNDYPVGTYAYTAKEKVGYPTQKPEALLERIIKTSSNEGGIIADLFCGSGTTGAVAERLGRRWIMCDLGRFAIHTSRKRLMEVQRKLKEGSKDYYPFEILNLGKYERQHWQMAVVNGGKNTPEGKKINQYLKFIIELYRGELINGFTNLHGKKDKSFVHIGAVDAPVTMNEIKEAVEECKKNKFISLDVLGWEWEMGVNEEAIKWAKSQSVKLRLLQIPREVMDKRAAESGEVKFFELDFVEVDIEKKGQEVRVVLKNFAIPSEEFIPNELREKITNWSDYIDYWSVDWDYASNKDSEGNYIFENDWQTFRTKKNPKLELETSWHRYQKKDKYLVLVKVIDIFGNDTSKIVEVKI